MLKSPRRPEPGTGYDEDFYLWTQQQARLLREGQFGDLDLAHLIDEVESVGRLEKREIRNRLEVLLAHLLKWKYQPEARKPGWASTIREQRNALAGLLSDSPSLRRRPAEIFAQTHAAARSIASRETGIAFALFPEDPPFTLTQALDPDFWPEEPGMTGAS